MNRKRLISLILAAALLSISFSGCLDFTTNENNYPYRERAEIESVHVRTDNGSVIAMIQTDLDDDDKLDEKNISVKHSENKILVFVPMSYIRLNESGQNLNNKINVPIGNITDFKDGTEYEVIVNHGYEWDMMDWDTHYNGNNEWDMIWKYEQDERTRFKFESGVLFEFEIVKVQEIKFREEKREVFADVTFKKIGKNAVIDGQKIAQTKFNRENEMDIYIPLKIEVDSANPSDETIKTTVAISPLNQLNDGRYSVEINDFESRFVIRNGEFVY